MDISLDHTGCVHYGAVHWLLACVCPCVPLFAHTFRLPHGTIPINNASLLALYLRLLHGAIPAGIASLLAWHCAYTRSTHCALSSFAARCPLSPQIHTYL